MTDIKDCSTRERARVLEIPEWPTKSKGRLKRMDMQIEERLSIMDLVSTMSSLRCSFLQSSSCYLSISASKIELMKA